MDINESESKDSYNEDYEPEGINMPIIKRFEDLYTDEKFQNIINFKDVRKGELYVNLIHYDKNLKNGDNMIYK